MIKILWLTENYPPNRGGMAQSCDRIVHNLRIHGLEVHVLHLTQRVNSIKITTVQKGKDIFYPAHIDMAHTLNCMWNFLEDYHQKEQLTHIVAFGGHFPMFSAPTFAAWLHIPLVTLLRGNDFDAGIFTPRKRHILEYCLQKSALVCSVSQDKIRKAKALFPQINTAYIPNGIDTVDWYALDSDIQQAQKWRKENVAEGKKVIGLFGHLKDKKGVNFFLNELCKIQSQQDFHLLIVGDLSEEVKTFFDENKALPEEQHLSYTLYPFMDRFELLSYYPACDVVAIPSFYDGLPNVLLEVGALGIPFIAANVAGMADVLENNVHGFLFKPGDSQTCREAIYRLQKIDISDLKQMGTQCKEMIAQQLSHHQEAENYIQAFQKTLYSVSESV